MAKIINNSWLDLDINFDEKWIISVNFSRWNVQDKINDLLSIQQDYEYLEKCKNELLKYKHIKKKTKNIQEEISFLEYEIDQIEEYIKLILQSVTKH